MANKGTSSIDKTLKMSKRKIIHDLKCPYRQTRIDILISISKQLNK
jgi:hypothetical protein